MSTQGNLAAALAFLPAWLEETNDPAGLETRLVGWAKACGWRAVGIVWPSDGPAMLLKTIQNGVSSSVSAPPELPEVARRLRQGESTATATATTGALRVYVSLQAPGRPTGVLWAERPVGVPCTDVDKSLVSLTARMVEVSPTFAAAVGPAVEPEKLLVRLQDAAVIAGRMAHDFDNILTGIIGFADLTLPLVPPGSQAATFITEVGKVGQRGIQFTQQLHQFSRSGQAKPNPTSIYSIVSREAARMKARTNSTVRFEQDVAPHLAPVAAEAGSVQTVLGTLLDNAYEACSAGGIVRVAVRAVELTDADARSYLGKVRYGGHLEVSVSDTGSGIKPEVRRRLFADPLYTTKVRHRGLGLAIVFRTLCAHKGGIRLDPAPPPSAGTVARFVLPLAVARLTAVANPTVESTPVGG